MTAVPNQFDQCEGDSQQERSCHEDDIAVIRAQSRLGSRLIEGEPVSGRNIDARTDSGRPTRFTPIEIFVSGVMRLEHLRGMYSITSLHINRSCFGGSTVDES